MSGVGVTRVRVPTAVLEGDRVELDGERFHYAVRVRRGAVGDPLELFDGEGARRRYTIDAIDADRLTAVATGDRETTDRAVAITSVLPLIKGDRMDQAIEKLTELGVARIALARTDRAVARLEGDRAERRRERFARLAEAAAGQCGRADVPVIDALADLADALAAPGAARRLIFDPSGAPLATLAGESAPSIAIATGPEGGFTDAELEAARAAGYQVASLGPRVLRAETAAIAAATAVGLLWGDLGPVRGGS